MIVWQKTLKLSLILAILFSFLQITPVAAQSGSALTAYDLIALVNGIRTGNGLPALEVSNILMSTAQSTAEVMAANRMGWHIGDVRGRVMAAGYGGGATVWATENFAVGDLSLEDLAWVWSDAAHMIPMVNPAYQHIGAGVAMAPDGSIYFLVHAAYTSGSPAARTQVPRPKGVEPTAPASQWIIPVTVATPNADGTVVHEVKMGQSLWSIAIAYESHIVDILRFNQMSPEQQVVWVGQKLSIPVTPQPVTPILEPSPSASTTPRAQAAHLNKVVTAAAVTRLPRPTALATPTPTQADLQVVAAMDINDRTVGYVLGGIFTAGVMLVGFGLLSRHKKNP
ncbi:MAG TPA: CAP domain-containing protein [Bellilinea sp.]|nr:CAP domain-containing protein [Bellilinea sp.]